MAVENWWITVVGVVVLSARFVAADAAGRARMRFLFLVLVAGLTFWSAAGVATDLGVPEDSALVVTFNSLGALTVVLIPVVVIHGILRHRLRLDLVVRKSVAYGVASLLIAAAYAAIAATPGLMLGNRIPVTLAVIITIAAALAFQPSAGGSNRRQQKAVWRSRTAVPAAQEPRHDDGADGRTRRATAPTRNGNPRRNRCSWVRVRLREADGSWLDEPKGIAGEVTEDSAAGVDLARAGELVGRVDLGPKPGGYAAADLELLATVAAQATTAVANVRLASQLKEGLEELSTSRVRLIAGRGASSDRARPA